MQQQQNMPGKMNDQVIAGDLLNGAKAAVRNYAYALTESYSQNVRSTLTNQLNDAITFHSQVSEYMVNKGYYNPHDIEKQIQIDMASAQQVMGTQATQVFSS